MALVRLISITSIGFPFVFDLIILLFIIVFFSFLIGFYYEENSAGGAGGLDRDFANTWNNLNTFLNYDISSALYFVETGDRNFYISSRMPLLYILNAKLNPFTYSVEVFIRSIFVLSIIGFMIFYYTLNISYSNDKIILLLLIMVKEDAQPEPPIESFSSLYFKLFSIFLSSQSTLKLSD